MNDLWFSVMGFGGGLAIIGMVVCLVRKGRKEFVAAGIELMEAMRRAQAESRAAHDKRSAASRRGWEKRRAKNAVPQEPTVKEEVHRRFLERE